MAAKIVNLGIVNQDQCQKELKLTKCTECKKTKQRNNFDFQCDGEHKFDRCYTCQYPACAACRNVAEEPVIDRSKKKDEWLCNGATLYLFAATLR